MSFAESLQERVADGDANPVALEHAEGPLKGNDGPSVDSALLDRLIVAFFEKGNIRSAKASWPSSARRRSSRAARPWRSGWRQ